MEMFTLTKKPAVLYLKTQIFDELQLKYISLNVPDFLQVNSTWYNSKNRTRSFFNCTRSS